MPGRVNLLKVQVPRGSGVQDLAEEATKKSQFPYLPDDVALWKLKDGEKVERLDSATLVDHLAGATVALDLWGGGESSLRLYGAFQRG